MYPNLVYKVSVMENKISASIPIPKMDLGFSFLNLFLVVHYRSHVSDR